MHVVPDGRSNHNKKSQTGRSKSGPISKVVRLSGCLHSKVPLYIYTSALIVQSHDDREVGALIVKGPYSMLTKQIVS